MGFWPSLILFLVCICLGKCAEGAGDAARRQNEHLAAVVMYLCGIALTVASLLVLFNYGRYYERRAMFETSSTPQ